MSCYLPVEERLSPLTRVDEAADEPLGVLPEKLHVPCVEHVAVRGGSLWASTPKSPPHFLDKTSREAVVELNVDLIV